MNECIIECDSPEQLKQLKEKATKVKMICLDKMGKPPLYNPRAMKDKEKNKLKEMMVEIFQWDEARITTEFNEIVNDKVLDNDCDITQYPIYNSGEPIDDSDDVINKLLVKSNGEDL
jgi:hypothetical protein